MSADTYYIWQNNNYAINNSTNTGGSNIQFIDIGTDTSFNSITGNNGRIGRRYAWPAASSGYTGNWKVNQYLTDISINYLDLSWNFYIAVDNSRNFMYGQAPGVPNGDGTYRDPIIHIYDISYNGRKYLGDVDASGNPYVPKIYDASGGQANAFSSISFLLTYKDNDSGGFTYSPQMFDPAEVLPSSGGGGGGTDPSGGTGGGDSGGGGQVDPSGGTDSSGNNTSDNSQNIFIIDNSLNAWFFDAPKASTNGTMTLNTNLGGGIPGLQTSWTNPTQKRAAFDFVGNNPPTVDSSGVGIETVDDYNYLPYFQGLKVQLVLYDQTGSVLGTGQGWTDITFNTNTSYIGGGGGISETWWEKVDFLPRELEAINIFNSTVSSGVNEYNFNSNTFAYAIPGTFGGQPTAGAKVRIRIAMVNRAQVTITDPSYVEHNATNDVSWNWIYLPETGGLAIGDYGDPTPPLTITVPTGSDLQYNRFNISGFNDNSGNDIVLSTANRNQAIVENELGTRFTSLDKNNASLPKIQYRYDLSGSKASSSLQVGGSQAGVGGINWIDISINIPDVADNSLNWIPSNANPDTDPNSWTSTLTSSTYPLIVFPEHNYKFTGYSMRYSLDPSRNNVDGYTDASLNSAWSSLSLWTTLRPRRNECTSTYADTLTNGEITGNYSRISGTWTAPVSQYLVTAGAYKAWENVGTIAAKTNLLFLNANTVVQYISPVGYNKSIRANGIVASNGNETFVGTETVNQDIIRMNSEVKEDGSGNWFVGWDLSGVQQGFGPPNLGISATNPTNNYLEWKTAQITNAYEITNDISRNGGYYCGTRLSDVKLKNINLTDYRDVSYNTSQSGYKVTIYQELKASAGSGWSRYPSASGGQYKLFNPATIPTEDISFNFASATFVINDGYDGTGSYEQGGRTNNFKFGQGVSQNATPNFFGLPLIYPSQDAISYSLTFSQFDRTWWPTNGNALDFLRFYVRTASGGGGLPSVYHSTKPSGNYIQWGGTSKTVTKPWSGASNGTNAFPDLPSNGVSTLTGDFDFDNTGTASFASNKYSRDLFDHNTYSLATPNTSNPFFYVDARYDNNILRGNRGGSNEESGDKRTIGEAYSSAGNNTNKNRFEGKGVGPDGKYLLFWDNTLNTSVTFQKVGDTGTSPFNNYPFVADGTTNDYTTAFDHTDKLSNGTTVSNGGDRQLIWAKNGFKPGGQTLTSITNPYIDYSGNYWFGNYTNVGINTMTQNYSNLNSIGETMHPANVDYTATSSGGSFSWWSDTTTSIRASFNWDTTLRFKFIVLKVPFKTGNIPSGGFRGFELSLQKSGGSLTKFPTCDSDSLEDGTAENPVVWWQEKGDASSHPSGTFNISGKTGWKALHKSYKNGLAVNLNNDNGAGSMYKSGYTGSGKKVHRVWGSENNAFDLYFRIGVPNGSSFDIQKVKVQFIEVDVSAGTYTNSSGTNASKTFTFLQ